MRRFADMPPTYLYTVAILCGLWTLAGCEGHEFHPPDRAQQVAQADSLYQAARFDTIQWTSDSLRLETGNAVYAAHCDRCHGTLGEGNAEYARAQELDAPSLVEPDWELGNDPDAVRRRIFTGHPDGMPTWGVASITRREIDAVTGYIMERLRPEMIGER